VLDDFGFDAGKPVNDRRGKKMRINAHSEDVDLQMHEIEWVLKRLNILANTTIAKLTAAGVPFLDLATEINEIIPSLGSITLLSS
jgi:hypothetical protein